MLELAEKDNNSVIKATVGDHVRITLEWKPSSGYIWQQAGTTAGILEEVRQEPSADLKPGSSAFVSFKFLIKSAGDIVLCLARPWSELEPPTKWFSVKVNI